MRIPSLPCLLPFLVSLLVQIASPKRRFSNLNLKFSLKFNTSRTNWLTTISAENIWQKVKFEYWSGGQIPSPKYNALASWPPVICTQHQYEKYELRDWVKNHLVNKFGLVFWKRIEILKKTNKRGEILYIEWQLTLNPGFEDQYICCFYHAKRKESQSCWSCLRWETLDINFKSMLVKRHKL